MNGRLLFVLLVFAALFQVHCTRNPGGTLRFQASVTHKLNGRACVGQSIASPFQLEIGAGEAVFNFANNGVEPVKILLDGSSYVLDPVSWTELTVTTGETVTVTWDGPELFLAEPFLKHQTVPSTPNVFLLSVDTLRHDYFTPEHMPLTYEVFQKGLVFKHIYSPAPWTLPAHASLLTSLYPASHGVRVPSDKLSASLTTLPGQFQDQGYRTHAFTEGNYVSATFGLNLGFHSFGEDAPAMMNSDPASASRLGANLTRFRNMMETATGDPLFVFFHTYEVHCPYLPRYKVKDPDGWGGTQKLLDNDGKPLSEDTYEHLRALYAAEVTYADSLLGPLLAELLEKNWVIALVSDHGDEFGEHGGLLHADNLYEEAVRVPFALAGPGISPGVRNTGGSLIDVPATLLTLLDFPIPPSWQGGDLLTKEDGGPVFSESFFFGPQIPARDPRVTAVWRDGHKLIQTRNFDQITAELYALESDPGELKNIQNEDVARRDQLFLMMEAYLKGKGTAAEKVGELTPEELETMRSLGYIR